MSITKERLIDIINTYVRNDAEGAESDYLDRGRRPQPTAVGRG